MPVETVTHNGMDDVIKVIKNESATPEVWETCRAWGQKTENVIRQEVDASGLEYEYYETGISLLPSTAQRNDDQKWIAGYLFLIDYSYHGVGDDVLHNVNKSCLLAWTDDKMIGELIELDELSNLKTLDAPH